MDERKLAFLELLSEPKTGSFIKSKLTWCRIFVLMSLNCDQNILHDNDWFLAKSWTGPWWGQSLSCDILTEMPRLFEPLLWTCNHEPLTGNFWTWIPLWFLHLWTDLWTNLDPHFSLKASCCLMFDLSGSFWIEAIWIWTPYLTDPEPHDKQPLCFRPTFNYRGLFPTSFHVNFFVYLSNDRTSSKIFSADEILLAEELGGIDDLKF